jgi:hypothetical protein
MAATATTGRRGLLKSDAVAQDPRWKFALASATLAVLALAIEAGALFHIELVYCDQAPPLDSARHDLCYSPYWLSAILPPAMIVLVAVLDRHRRRNATLVIGCILAATLIGATLELPGLFPSVE